VPPPFGLLLGVCHIPNGCNLSTSIAVTDMVKFCAAYGTEIFFSLVIDNPATAHIIAYAKAGSEKKSTFVQFFMYCKNKTSPKGFSASKCDVGNWTFFLVLIS
jgi:hypothetical protein